MNIVKYLIYNGYKAYRWSESGYLICNNNFDFSSMRVGGSDVRLVKGNSEFIYGLHEKNKPPTLIFPRTFDLQLDDKMNKYLSENSSEYIFNELFPLSIVEDIDSRFKNNLNKK